MTQTDIDFKRRALAQKHKKHIIYIYVKIAFAFGAIAAIIISVVDMCSSTAERPILSGFIIMAVLILLVLGWNFLAYCAYQKQYKNELAQLNTMEHRLEEYTKNEAIKQLEQNRLHEAQEALVSLAKLREAEQHKLPTNCPNCGAVLKDSICGYCGTHVS